MSNIVQKYCETLLFMSHCEYLWSNNKIKVFYQIIDWMKQLYDCEFCKYVNKLCVPINCVLNFIWNVSLWI